MNSNRRLAGGGMLAKFLDVAPELVVEIISPTHRWVDMLSKICYRRDQLSYTSSIQKTLLLRLITFLRVQGAQPLVGGTEGPRGRGAAPRLPQQVLSLPHGPLI